MMNQYQEEPSEIKKTIYCHLLIYALNIVYVSVYSYALDDTTKNILYTICLLMVCPVAIMLNIYHFLAVHRFICSPSASDGVVKTMFANSVLLYILFCFYVSISLVIKFHLRQSVDIFICYLILAGAYGIGIALDTANYWYRRRFLSGQYTYIMSLP